MGLLAATEEVVTTIPEALINTVIGMGTVFLVLILISFIIYLMKFIPELLDNRNRSKEPVPVPAAKPAPIPAAKPAPVPAAKPAAALTSAAAPARTDDTQLAAVITAAIMAAMEQEGTPVAPDGLVIRSIKKRF